MEGFSTEMMEHLKSLSKGSKDLGMYIPIIEGSIAEKNEWIRTT